MFQIVDDSKHLVQSDNHRNCGPGPCDEEVLALWRRHPMIDWLIAAFDGTPETEPDKPRAIPTDQLGRQERQMVCNSRLVIHLRIERIDETR